MRSIPQAMMWETMVRGWWAIPLYFVGGNLLPFFLYNALYGMYWASLSASDNNALVIQLTLVPYALCIFAMGVAHAQSRYSRHYTMPVRTETLVAWHMFPGAAILGVQAAMTTVALNYFFNVHWSLLSTMMVAVATWCSMQFVIHTSKRTVLGGLLGILPCIFVLGAWAMMRWLDPNDKTIAAQGIGVIAIIGASYAWTVHGIARDRCGETWMNTGLLNRISNLFEATGETSIEQYRAFRSPSKAQNWYQWKQKGLALPFAYLTLLTIISCVWLVSVLLNRDGVLATPNNPDNVLIPFGMLVVLLAMVAGLFLGLSKISGTRDQTFSDLVSLVDVYTIGSFDGALPQTNALMAKSILRTALFSVGLSQLIWAVFALAAISLTAYWAGIERELHREVGHWYLPLVVLGPWVAMTNMATIALTGRFARFVFAFVPIASVYLLGINAISHWVAIDACKLINAILLFSLAVLLMVGVAFAFAVAKRKGYVQDKEIWFSSSVFVAVVATILMSSHSISIVEASLTCTLASLVIAPLATTPLAIAWNRHR